MPRGDPMPWEHGAMTLDVRLATDRDVPGIAALEARHYVGNLDPAEVRTDSSPSRTPRSGSAARGQRQGACRGERG